MNRNLVIWYFMFIVSHVSHVSNSFCTVQSLEKSCFRAAVFEHVQQSEYNSANASHIIDLNLKVYENVAKQAASYGANIIVFPEDGIFNPETRKGVRPYLEEIPSPSNSTVYNPCEEPDKYMKNRPILYRLSCLAKKYHMYVVADMGDIQPCNNKNDCPPDGFYQFNTAVIFDDSGNLVVKYHKMHLFGEIYYNLPPKPEFMTIDTPFGRLGVQICFDMIYGTPGVYEAEQLNVDTIVLPTWWFDEMPFLTASQYQQSWAITNKVNLLASNIHKPKVGSLGSGIYSGESGAVIYTNTPDGYPKLLIADIPVSTKSKVKCSSNPKLINVTSMSNSFLQPEYIYFNMSLKNTEQILLKKSSDLMVECHNGLCCQLNYTLGDSSFQDKESYYLIVSNRTRDGPYPWSEEFCALVRCEPDLSHKCSTFPKSISKTKFHLIELKANFSTYHVYPSVMTNNNKLIDRKDWSFSIKKPRTELTLYDFNKPIHTYGLYGRSYERDPQFVQVDIGIL